MNRKKEGAVSNFQPAALKVKICIADLQLRTTLKPKNGKRQQRKAAKVGMTARARIVKLP
jgi:hypothetical protein